FASQLIFLALALAFTPEVIRVLAPGFEKDPGRFTLAVDLTRITFPYLLLMTLVTLYGGILNALNRFAAAAAAPILLNLTMMTTLALAVFFPSAGHAAAWVGTVLLPEMSRRIAAGDESGARHSQSRAIELALLLSVPCVAAFLIVPDLIMRALFVRGAFTAADAAAAGATLAAYAIGLLPFVLIRSAIATFLARGDTATPLKAALVAAAVNIAFKLVLTGPLAQVGLALATTIGAWINFGLVIFFAARRGLLGVDPRLM